MPASISYANRRPCANRERGFSLIEILVAFMILAMALTVIFRIFSGGLRNVSLSEDYARAQLVADSRLSVVGISEPMEPGVTSGEWNERFQWQRVIEPYRPWDKNKPLIAAVNAYQITVNVQWQHSAGESQVSVRSIRLMHTPKVAGASG